uniref:phosphatidylserine decarboxylase n=1 Tax=Ciona savignyi TaxID=51511 RepID=H2YIT1_CIOSA
MQVTLLPMIPFRHISRTWGKVCSLYIPCIFRPLVYGIYIKAFGVEMTEAIPSDMRCYKNLGELFRRRIDMKLRPVDSSAQIVSPVDGRVLYSGLLCDGRVEQLKGMSYSVQQLMGPLRDTNAPPSSSTEYVDRVLMSKRNKLFTCTIYLAPGDYHRFHSPVSWTVLHRRHFAGELLSVNPRMLSWFPQLFVTNERVVLSGRWRHGFFSFTAVGATNVGSIVVYHDKCSTTRIDTNPPPPQMLTTNQPNLKVGSYVDHSYGDGVSFSEGEALGEFRFGSTVVLIYEAPANADIFCSADEIIKCGQKVSCKC